MNSLFIGNCVRLTSNARVTKLACNRWYFNSKSPAFALHKRILIPAKVNTVNSQRSMTIWQIQEWINRWNHPRGIDLYKLDRLNPDEYTMVYRRDTLLKWASMSAYLVVTLAAGLTFTFCSWYFKERTTNEEILDFEDQRWTVYIGLVVAFVTVVPFLVVVNRIVPRVYYNRANEKYLLITYNILNPFRTKSFAFSPGEASAKDVSPFLAIFGNIVVKNRNFNLREDCFKLPVYANVMFGYESKDALKKFEDTEDADMAFRRQRQSH